MPSPSCVWPVGIPCWLTDLFFFHISHFWNGGKRYVTWNLLFSLFEVCGPVALSTVFVQLTPPFVSGAFFIPQNRNFVLIKQKNSSFLSPSAPETTILSSVPVNRTTLCASCSWSNRICVLLRLAYFTWRNVFRVHPCSDISTGSQCPNFLPLQGWRIFSCMYIKSYIVYPSVCWWILGLLLPFGRCE